MGEYARYKGDEIEIGTCSDMYYLRWEDRNRVQALPGNVDPARDDGLRFRLPFPDEDHLEPGDYDPFRGLVLTRFSDPTTAADPGTIQLKHECGLLVNVACYHGEQLPAKSDELKAFWNGMSPSFYELVFVKTTAEGVFPIVQCRYCRNMYRYEWADIIDYIPEGELKRRLSIHFPMNSEQLCAHEGTMEASDGHKICGKCGDLF